MGPSGLHKILAGFQDKAAEAVCTYALMENEERIIFFKGFVSGHIVEPRGGSWGWDPVFEEVTTSLTFGEMSAKDKSVYSHRAKAITVLKRYLAIG